MGRNHSALDRAIKAAGGQLALAKALGTSQSNVWTWLMRSKRGTPPEWVLAVERVTGIPRHELRPDIYPAPSAREVA